MPDYCDLFSLRDDREIRFEWPTDLRESEVRAILIWLEILEGKIVDSSNENERLRTADSHIPPSPAGGKK
jgi:hypothetical protein